jgi:hypothetical protein
MRYETLYASPQWDVDRIWKGSVAPVGHLNTSTVAPIRTVHLFLYMTKRRLYETQADVDDGDGRGHYSHAGGGPVTAFI